METHQWAIFDSLKTSVYSVGISILKSARWRFWKVRMFSSAFFFNRQTQYLIKDTSVPYKTSHHKKRTKKQQPCKLISVASQGRERLLCSWKSCWHVSLPTNLGVRCVCMTDMLWKAAVINCVSVSESETCTEELSSPPSTLSTNSFLCCVSWTWALAPDLCGFRVAVSVVTSNLWASESFALHEKGNV